MTNNSNYGFATRAIRHGQDPEKTTGAVIPPIFQTSTYAQESPGKNRGYEYSRTHNPTRSALAQCVAELENMKYGLAFSSGCAAVSTLMHFFEPNDHIICSDDCYGGTFRLFDQVFQTFGIQFTFLDLRDDAKVRDHIEPNTKCIWVETPTNPTLKVVDLKSINDIAHEHGILTVVDNTFLSPFFQKPADFGTDIIIHSATKYLNGHSDVVAGILTLNNDELAEKLAYLSNSIGAILGPMDSWLVLRGIKTLALRMSRHEENANKVVDFLINHPLVEKVLYPGHPSHPDYEVMKKQTTGAGGVVTFYLKGGLKESRKFLESTKLFILAESLGGVESLIEHPAIMTHASVPDDLRKSLGITNNLIRLSIGIEEAEDLIDDLDNAFSKIG
ncbi:MAG: PLP-dependent transferase [Bacteriovoracaceae bacterium]|nr:PLP-dependent transferase [Bacteriovoracaceae bacterium]